METLESKSFKTRHGTISVSLNKDNKGYFVVNKLVDNNGKITEVEKTGCEGIADFLYEYVNTIYLPSFGKGEAERVWCSKVEVRETDANMAMRVGHREHAEFV